MTNPFAQKVALVVISTALAVGGFFLDDEARLLLFSMSSAVFGWAALKRPGDTAP